jgi:Tfp pilus assembly pilus retraction ATPase PilT
MVALEKMDLLTAQIDAIEMMIARPEGMVLVTGPTGSGKTTTLYSILAKLNKEGVNIMTLEDPVEYPLPMVRQSNLASSTKLDFSGGIRSLMRQDPDIILVGEIRDADTATQALRAAMTGHLVFSTLHPNSALGIDRPVLAWYTINPNDAWARTTLYDAINLRDLIAARGSGLTRLVNLCALNGFHEQAPEFIVLLSRRTLTMRNRRHQRKASQDGASC